MKNELIKVSLWVVGIIVVAWIIGRAFVEAANIYLAVQQRQQDHQEKMCDQLIQYQQQAFGCSQHYSYAQSEFRKEV